MAITKKKAWFPYMWTFKRIQHETDLTPGKVRKFLKILQIKPATLLSWMRRNRHYHYPCLHDQIRINNRELKLEISQREYAGYKPNKFYFHQLFSGNEYSLRPREYRAWEHRDGGLWLPVYVWRLWKFYQDDRDFREVFEKYIRKMGQEV